ncbi:MAG TPA: hypothetical protein VE999_07050 [Gemmataceae bacterium]|jgi:hypothetical protein|nr:hypothetical protein [Gemmataceae bacterium]
MSLWSISAPNQYGQDVGTATAVSVAIGSLAVADAMTAAGGTLATLDSALTRCWPASLLIAEIEFPIRPRIAASSGIGKPKALSDKPHLNAVSQVELVAEGLGCRAAHGANSCMWS